MRIFGLAGQSGNQFISPLLPYPMYEAIPVVVPILFIIGIVGALFYDRSRQNAE